MNCRTPEPRALAPPLPLEVVLRIVVFCVSLCDSVQDVTRELCRLALVSRAWRDAVRLFYRSSKASFYVSEALGSSAMNALHKHWYATRFYDWRQLTSSNKVGERSVLRPGVRLIAANISTTFNLIWDVRCGFSTTFMSDVKETLAKCHRVKKWMLQDDRTDSSTSYILGCIPITGALESVDIRSFRFKGDKEIDAMELILSTAPGLKEVYFTECAFSALAEQKLAAALPSGLTALVLSNMYTTIDESRHILASLESKRELTELRLRGLILRQPECLTGVLRSCRSLVHLELDFVLFSWRTTEEGLPDPSQASLLEEIATLPKLHRLRINGHRRYPLSRNYTILLKPGNLRALRVLSFGTVDSDALVVNLLNFVASHENPVHLYFDHANAPALLYRAPYITAAALSHGCACDVRRKLCTILYHVCRPLDLTEQHPLWEIEWFNQLA